MTQITISAEEVFDVYKKQISDLHHELILANLQLDKLKAKLAEYEKAEADRVRVAAVQRSAAVESTGATETASQPVMALPPVPSLPGAPGSLLRT